MLTTLTFSAALLLSCPTDTGAVSVDVLTPTILDAYVAVERPLSTYWMAHPERKAAADSQAKHYQTLPDGNASIGVPLLEYTQLITHDTTVAAIFARAHERPDHFTATQITVRLAIWDVLLQQTPDSNTISGRNMQLVQTHRAQLATDFTTLQSTKGATDNVQQNLMNWLGGGQSNQSGQP